MFLSDGGFAWDAMLSGNFNESRSTITCTRDCIEANYRYAEALNWGSLRQRQRLDSQLKATIFSLTEIVLTNTNALLSDGALDKSRRLSENDITQNAFLWYPSGSDPDGQERII